LNRGTKSKVQPGRFEGPPLQRWGNEGRPCFRRRGRSQPVALGYLTKIRGWPNPKPRFRPNRGEKWIHACFPSDHCLVKPEGLPRIKKTTEIELQAEKTDVFPFPATFIMKPAVRRRPRATPEVGYRPSRPSSRTGAQTPQPGAHGFASAFLSEAAA